MEWKKSDIDSYPLWQSYGDVLDNMLFEIIKGPVGDYTLRTKIGDDFQNEIGRFDHFFRAEVVATLIDRGMKK